jgi:hypothetical protein
VSAEDAPALDRAAPLAIPESVRVAAWRRGSTSAELCCDPARYPRNHPKEISMSLMDAKGLIDA